MTDLLRMLARWLTASAPYMFAILLGLIIIFLLASIVMAIAVLFWWAGWTDRRVAQPATTAPAAHPAAVQHRVYNGLPLGDRPHFEHVLHPLRGCLFGGDCRAGAGSGDRR